MKTNDYVKFLTETLLNHWSTPVEERKKQKVERKQQKQPFVYKAFGEVPYSVLYGVKMVKNKRLKKKAK